MAGEDRRAPQPGIVLVDKPGGVTSHDVVSRARRAFGTRKIGHAGTLDPMATGLLVLGVEGATRLLTYLVGLDKTYTATVRLGERTDSDDADGTVIAAADASGITADDLERAAAPLRGSIEQVPSSVSAIKVNGQRAYALARAGEDVQLQARTVTVSRLELGAVRMRGTAVEVDIEVDCSSGTYVRALARDLGEALGVGGHLTALRRTRIGPFSVADAVASLDALPAAQPLSPARAAAAVLGTIAVNAQEATDLRHGKRLPGAAVRADHTPIAAVDPDGTLVGILERRGDDLKSTMNMPEVHA